GLAGLATLLAVAVIVLTSSLVDGPMTGVLHLSVPIAQDDDVILGGLRDALDKRQIALAAILTTSEQTWGAGVDLGLALDLPRNSLDQDSELEPIESDLEGDEAILIHHTLRSGHTIRHPGHVIVIGDVNPGEEVVAGGNVMIWGRIRGVVHASAAGNTNAVLRALDLAPTQLRIGSQISISPERKGEPRTARTPHA
ncbi:MAG: hypothetical protein IH787_07665, partial [Nitrospirae bacterium]|nr:hypothetical protein [Nitrospirota bacterium]